VSLGSTPQLVLASASPRRRDLLRAVGLAPDLVLPANIDERPQGSPSPPDHALRLATEKAERILSTWTGGPALVLAADTVVYQGHDLFEKAANPAEALRILTALNGRSHAVTTAWAICPMGGQAGIPCSGTCTTIVHFRQLSPSSLAAYAATGEGLDKAGAYGVQGLGAALVARLDGDLSNVVGLPLEPVLAAFATFGVFPHASVEPS
jgi:septum formation protein